MSAQGLVRCLIEGDNEDIRELIYAYLDRPSVEFDIGFAIGTSDGSVIEQNAEEQGIQVNWDVINEYVSVIERNALSVLNEIPGLMCRDEGHDSYGDLAGSAWVTTDTPGFTVVHGFASQDDPYRTSSGTIWNIPGMRDDTLFKNVPDDVARIIEVYISFFALEKFKEHADL